MLYIEFIDILEQLISFFIKYFNYNINFNLYFFHVLFILKFDQNEKNLYFKDKVILFSLNLALISMIIEQI
jgi:hypothetical protein